MAALPPFIARYEIKQRLGQGGMGAIYLARDPVIDRLVALKLLHNDVASDDIRKRFAQEARASGALTHPNIVTIHDYGEFEDSPFIVMEYVRGETLAEMIRRGTEVAITQKLRWVEQVCNALGYAHGENVVHRDVKPSNLMVDQHGVIKVLDFGIARIVGAGLTKMSMVIGTPGYMSPEQIQGGVIDARSDIFAVGAVLYELLSYREAFAAETPHAIMSKVVGADPIPLRQFLTGADLSIADVVDRALQKRPEARYSSMAALEVAVRMARLALESQKTEVTVLPRGRQPSPPSRRRRTDPVEIQRRRAEQIDLHLRDARAARDAGEIDAAIVACEAALLLDPACAPALALLDDVRPETAMPRPAAAAPPPPQPRPAPVVPHVSIPPPAPPAAAPPPSAYQPSSIYQPSPLPQTPAPPQPPPAPKTPGPKAPAQPWPPQVYDVSRTVATQTVHEVDLDRLRPWEETIASSAPPVVIGAAPAGRGPLVWILSIAAVAALAFTGWTLGVWSVRPAGSLAEVAASGGQPPTAAKAPTGAPAQSASQSQAGAAAADRTTPATVPVEDPLERLAVKEPVPAPEVAPPPVRPAERQTPPLEAGPLAIPPAPRAVDPGPTLRLAEAAEARGDLNQALAHYRDALRIDPRNNQATRAIARIRAAYLVRRAEGLLEAGDFDAAQRDAVTALETDPGNPAATGLLKKIEQARTDPRKRPPL